MTRRIFQILCQSFPNLTILSLIGNPFHKMLEAPVKVSDGHFIIAIVASHNHEFWLFGKLVFSFTNTTKWLWDLTNYRNGEWCGGVSMRMVFLCWSLRFRPTFRNSTTCVFLYLCISAKASFPRQIHNPDTSTLTIPVLQVLHYRLEVISRISQLRWVYDKKLW